MGYENEEAASGNVDAEGLAALKNTILDAHKEGDGYLNLAEGDWTEKFAAGAASRTNPEQTTGVFLRGAGDNRGVEPTEYLKRGVNVLGSNKATTTNPYQLTAPPVLSTLSDMGSNPANQLANQKAAPNLGATEFSMHPTQAPTAPMPDISGLNQSGSATSSAPSIQTQKIESILGQILLEDQQIRDILGDIADALGGLAGHTVHGQVHPHADKYDKEPKEGFGSGFNPGWLAALLPFISGSDIAGNMLGKSLRGMFSDHAKPIQEQYDKANQKRTIEDEVHQAYDDYQNGHINQQELDKRIDNLKQHYPSKLVDAARPQGAHSTARPSILNRSEKSFLNYAEKHLGINPNDSKIKQLEALRRNPLIKASSKMSGKANKYLGLASLGFMGVQELGDDLQVEDAKERHDKYDESYLSDMRQNHRYEDIIGLGSGLIPGGEASMVGGVVEAGMDIQGMNRTEEYYKHKPGMKDAERAKAIHDAKKRYGISLGADAGMATGALTGAAIGAGVGFLFGGVGAVPGALIGGAIGSVAGPFVGMGGAAVAEHQYEHDPVARDRMDHLDPTNKNFLWLNDLGNRAKRSWDGATNFDTMKNLFSGPAHEESTSHLRDIRDNTKTIALALTNPSVQQNQASGQKSLVININNPVTKDLIDKNRLENTLRNIQGLNTFYTNGSEGFSNTAGNKSTNPWSGSSGSW